MWRKTYNDEWERRNAYLLHEALDDDVPSNLPPEPVNRSSLFRVRSPLPELIIERVPKVDHHDEPVEFYQKLEITVQNNIEKLNRGGYYSDRESSAALQVQETHREKIDNEGYINTGPIYKKKNQEPLEQTKQTNPREELHFENETGKNDLDSNQRHNSIEDNTGASCEMTDSRDGDIEQMRASAMILSETYVPQDNSSEASVPDDDFMTRRDFSLIGNSEDNAAKEKPQSSRAATNQSLQSINLNDSYVNEVRSPISGVEVHHRPSPSPAKRRRNVGVQTDTPTYLSLLEGLNDNYLLMRVGNTITRYNLCNVSSESI